MQLTQILAANFEEKIYVTHRLQQQKQLLGRFVREGLRFHHELAAIHSYRQLRYLKEVGVPLVSRKGTSKRVPSNKDKHVVDLPLLILKGVYHCRTYVMFSRGPKRKWSKIYGLGYEVPEQSQMLICVASPGA